MQRRITLLAHNIRSLWNVGSLFRTCDAFGVEKIYLTGYTATPPRREISKTALGAEESVAWEYQQDPHDVLRELRSDGWTVVALEQSDDSADISDFPLAEKICLIIGHEVSGVPEDLLTVADHAVEIPMMGTKESLNVAVATGIALYQARA